MVYSTTPSPSQRVFSSAPSGSFTAPDTASRCHLRSGHSSAWPTTKRATALPLEMVRSLEMAPNGSPSPTAQPKRPTLSFEAPTRQGSAPPSSPASASALAISAASAACRRAITAASRSASGAVSLPAARSSCSSSPRSWKTSERLPSWLPMPKA